MKNKNKKPFRFLNFLNGLTKLVSLAEKIKVLLDSFL